MRVLVAGATGVIGRQLVPQLVDAGHRVISLVRPDSPTPPATTEFVVADAFDAAAIGVAARTARPDAVVDVRTAIPRRLDPRRFAAQMTLTNRLRSQATPILVGTVGRDVRIITQSLAYAYRPVPGRRADEGAELWSDGPRPFRPSVAALQRLEDATARHDGLTLRVGHLYGPGTAFAADGMFVELIRRRRAPIVGAGAGTFSFVHTYDVATAIVATLDHPVTGVVNIVDDDPAAARDWLPTISGLLGAPPPRRIPTWLARFVAGSWSVAYMNQIVGADNQRARDWLDWHPSRPSWRQGIADELNPPDNSPFGAASQC
jgi:nucleoside-diphosphate-sugar epimerase